MPKTKTRKKGTGGVRSVRMHGGETSHSSSSRPAEAVPLRDAQRLKRPVSGQQSLQNLMMAAMVALGCWGFAISFTFFTNNPDRYVLGVMAALLALTWSIYFGVRLRKWRQKR